MEGLKLSLYTLIGDLAKEVSKADIGFEDLKKYLGESNDCFNFEYETNSSDFSSYEELFWKVTICSEGVKVTEVKFDFFDLNYRLSERPEYKNNYTKVMKKLIEDEVEGLKKSLFVSFK